MPLGKVARKQWLECVAAYTIAGAMSSALIGSLLGLIGRGFRTKSVIYGVVPLALILAARELGWVRFELPESKAQTRDFWAREFGFATASAMWGFHIGLGFATRITFGGFLILSAMSFALGGPSYGAVLMSVYWLGRAMPVWFIPALICTESCEGIQEAILKNRPLYHRLVAAALLWSAGVAILSAWEISPSLFNLIR